MKKKQMSFVMAVIMLAMLIAGGVTERTYANTYDGSDRIVVAGQAQDQAYEEDQQSMENQQDIENLQLGDGGFSIEGFYDTGYFDNFNAYYRSEGHQYMTSEERQEATNKAREIAAMYNYGSTYEKVYHVYHYLCDNISYDYSYEKGSLYDALILGDSVCAGYCGAFQYIMQEMGIECYICVHPEDEANHGWNAVNIDGEYYYVDATYGDTGRQLKKYLLFGTDVRSNHTDLPIADHTYVRKNGLCISYDGTEWRYYEDGMPAGYTGMADNEYGWWYVNNGTIDFNYTGMACNEYGWWYFKNGAIDFSYTGMACNEYGWWYYANGTLDFSYNGMACNEYGWWRVINGKIDMNYTGVAHNEYGWWLFSNGAINLWDHSFSGMFIDGTTWRMFSNGEWNSAFTGMACNEYGWWYFENGTIDLEYTGMACNEYGWWYFTDGAIDTNYSGIGENEYGKWFYDNGRIDFDFSGYYWISYGTGYKNVYDIEGGKVIREYIDYAS